MQKERTVLSEKAALFKNNASRIHEFKKALRALNAGGITPIVLKGAYLSEKIYRDLGVRRFDDIDIMVKKEEFPGTESILFGLGYSHTAPQRVPYSLKFGSQVSFIKGVSVIDVHWDIVDLDRFNMVTAIEVNDFWEHSRVIDLFDGKVAEFSNEYLLLYLLLHLALQHSFAGSFLYEDIKEVVRQSKIGWDEIVNKARQYKVKKPVYFGLYYSREFCGAEIPDKTLLSLKPKRWGVVDQYVIGILSKRKYFNKMDHLIMPLMLDSWKDRFCFLLGNPKGSPGYIFHSFNLIIDALKKLPLLLKN
ncbi:nucleotidyltransferase family protein [Candidatus Omnitrophota bacterium]